MRKLFKVTALFTGLFFSGSAFAACDPGKPGSELTGAEAQEVYECIAEALYDGYNGGNTRWVDKSFVEDYRGWTPASRFPAAPGVHGDRFLLTWVNETGADEYLKYAEEPSIPPGTLIAKESFSVTANGKVKAGPIFFMEKVAAGQSPETDDWYYSLVAPNGNAVGVNVMTACNECHMGGFGYQGGLGYPVEEARIGQ